VESSFPLFFVAIFLSSINLPRDLIQADWFRAIATLNPVSYLVEGIRSLIITGWDGQALILGFGCALALILVTLAGAASSMRTRMASS
jgi:ABC-2 type transport system permease protein